MLRHFEDAVALAGSAGEVRLAVAAAGDAEVLAAVIRARETFGAQPILVGDPATIAGCLTDIGYAGDAPQVVPVSDPVEAARAAVALVHDGHAEVLVKGMVNSSDFLKAVLDPRIGLRTGRVLSHLAIYQVPGQPRLQFHTDGGLNVAPDLTEKLQILTNALLALHAFGIPEPKVAVLTANEQVTASMPATLDAAAIVAAAAAGELPAAIVEGPVALDVAVRPDAAAHKGIHSRITGEVDLFLVPNIETGNVFGKALICFAGGQMAGLVLGASHPIVLTSRADSADGKLHSIALATILGRRHD